MTPAPIGELGAGPCILHVNLFDRTTRGSSYANQHSLPWKQRVSGGVPMCIFARRSVTILGLLLLLPAAAFAQGAITGVVKDASGAVLPGVTVEAASPVLI